MNTPLPIPRHWTADQALLVADFLVLLLDALCEVHGEQMHRRDRELAHPHSPPEQPPQPESP